MTIYPKYTYPFSTIAGLIRDVILLQPRAFHMDAKACIQHLKPLLHVIGKGNIPQRGPCVVTVNHYYRAGFEAQWIALSIAAMIPADMHWVMTGELTYPGKWYAPIGTAASRLILNRVARVYGFATMPPMPPRPSDVETRAASIRKVLDYVKTVQNPILGLAPEGKDSLNGKLAHPASGLGRFGLLLAGHGLKFVPVGAYESEGELCLRFGEVYELSIPRGLSAEDRDRQAADQIMKNIAKLLPKYLRGEFE